MNYFYVAYEANACRRFRVFPLCPLSAEYYTHYRYIVYKSTLNFSRKM
jgi:hypothetical protein